MSYRFTVNDSKNLGTGEINPFCLVLFVTCDPEDENEDVQSDDIGYHCPEVQRVLAPIGMQYEDEECSFTQEPRQRSNDELIDYLTNMGWVYDPSLDD